MAVLTDRDGIDHDSYLGNTPAHDKGPNTEVLLE